jgi:hypothetical protein
MTNISERFLYIESGLRRGIESVAMTLPRLALRLRGCVPCLVRSLIPNEHDQVAFDSKVVFRAREAIAAESARPILSVELEQSGDVGYIGFFATVLPE